MGVKKMKIALVTDSTCDLNSALTQKYNINIIPLRIHFGTEEYIDGVDISSLSFFEKLNNNLHMPKTSKPSKQTFLDKYRELSLDYDKIISIHVSKGLSGTYESAKLAANELGNDKVYVFDSASISLGLGFQVIMAAKLIEKNYKLTEIYSRLKKSKQKISCIFTVEDLTYMKEGGRIGPARAFLGSIFNINPIIEISPKTGKVNPLNKVRGNKNTLAEMSKLLYQQIKEEKIAWIGIMHGDRKEKAKLLTKKAKELIPESIKTTFLENRISPTLGCHVGPSVYAFAALYGDLLDI